MPSKLTFHINVFDEKIFDLLQQMQPTTIKVYDYPSDSNIDEIRRRCPRALIVFRHYTDLGFNSPADAYVAELTDALNKLGGRGIIWEGLNEPILQSEQDARTLSTWFARFAELMHARGEKVAAFSFSTGNPRLEWVPLLAPAARACDYIALHEYYSPTSGASDLARYRAFRAKLPTDAQKPILITECGFDAGGGINDGWQAHVSADEYMNILANYDKQLLQDNYVLGATIFQYGGGQPWQSFNVVSIGRRIADYVMNAGGGGNPPGDGGGGAPAPIEQAVIAAAKKYHWMPINTDGALYKFAQSNNLGYPQTDEFEFTFNNEVYVGQVYNLGIVYVKKGDWSNCKWVKKP